MGYAVTSVSAATAMMVAANTLPLRTAALPSRHLCSTTWSSPNRGKSTGIAQPDRDPTGARTENPPVPTGIGFRGMHQESGWLPSKSDREPSKSDREALIRGGEGGHGGVNRGWWDGEWVCPKANRIQEKPDLDTPQRVGKLDTQSRNEKSRKPIRLRLL